MNEHTVEFIRLMKHPVKFRMFLFLKLPSAFFAGVRIKDISEEFCTVIVPYKWFSQNPFKSTYFACLAMAAEMTTGSLGLAHIHKRKPAISMLVVKIEGNYFKKATGITSFTCNDGIAIRNTIEEAVAKGEPRSFRALSTGINKDGEKVAEFFVTWSFKQRSTS